MKLNTTSRSFFELHHTTTLARYWLETVLLLSSAFSLALLLSIFLLDASDDKLLPPRFLRISTSIPALMASGQAGLLSQLLKSKKKAFLDAVNNGTELDKWVVSVGNEAGGPLSLSDERRQASC